MLCDRLPGLSENIIALIIKRIPPKNAKRESISPIGTSKDEMLFFILDVKEVEIISQAGSAIEMLYNNP